MATLQQLHDLGQSTWLNYLRGSFIHSGELSERLKQGIQGVTANAQVYERAIRGSSDYDTGIRREMAAGKPARHVHEALMVDDIQRAADALHPIFEASHRLDGFVSYEMDPSTLQSVPAAVAEVRHLSHHIDRYNVMVEVPATPIGIAAVRDLVADGVSVNVTHLFSLADYEAVAAGYLAGLEQYITSHSVWRTAPTAVASFSLAPIDAAVDAQLEALGRPDLTGKTAVALARRLYARYQQLFSGPAWDKLAARRGQPLRPKWTRTTPRDFRHAPLYYIEQLIGPGTVMTFSPAALNVFLREGIAAVTLNKGLDAAETHLATIAALGIDLEALAGELKAEHLAVSERRFHTLVEAVAAKRNALDMGRETMALQLGGAQAGVDEQVHDAEGLGGDSSACAAGDGVVACGLLRNPVVESRVFFGPLHEFGNHPVAKEGDLLTALCITVGHGGLLRSTQAVCLPGTRYAVAPGGSGPVSCWMPFCGRGLGRGRGRNPSGAGNTCSSAAAVPRKATNTVAAAGGVPNAVSVGASAANGSGNSPRSSDNAAWTADTRRRTQRNAPGNSMSRRSVSHSTSRLGADSAARTTASTSAKVPESRAARQSGSKLNVRCPAGQYQRAIRVPGGETR